MRVQATLLQKAAELRLAGKRIGIGSPSAERAARDGEMKDHSATIKELRARPAKPKGGPLLVSSVTGATSVLQSESVEEIDEQLRELLESVSGALATAWGNWQSSAKLTGVMINGPVGDLPPSGLQGIGLDERLVMTRVRARAARLKNVAKARTAKGSTVKMASRETAKGRSIAKAREDSPSSASKPKELEFYLWHAQAMVSACCSGFAAWQRGYSVQLAYPTAAICSATLPPSPNVPLPLVAGRSPGDSALRPKILASRMLAAYGTHERHPKLTEALFDSFAAAFAQTFETWKATTMITQVIGVGGVAPPPPLPPGPVAGAVGNGGSIV